MNHYSASVYSSYLNESFYNYAQKARNIWLINRSKVNREREGKREKKRIKSNSNYSSLWILREVRIYIQPFIYIYFRGYSVFVSIESRFGTTGTPDMERKGIRKSMYTGKNFRVSAMISATLARTRGDGASDEE